MEEGEALSVLWGTARVGRGGWEQTAGVERGDCPGAEEAGTIWAAPPGSRGRKLWGDKLCLSVNSNRQRRPPMDGLLQVIVNSLSPEVHKQKGMA